MAKKLWTFELRYFAIYSNRCLDIFYICVFLWRVLQIIWSMLFLWIPSLLTRHCKEYNFESLKVSMIFLKLISLGSVQNWNSDLLAPSCLILALVYWDVIREMPSECHSLFCSKHKACFSISLTFFPTEKYIFYFYAYDNWFNSDTN